VQLVYGTKLDEKWCLVAISGRVLTWY